MRRVVFTSILLFTLYVVPLWAACSGADSLLTPVGQCFTLPNGLAVRLFATEGDPHERTEVRLALRVGSAYEGKGEEGVAHFIEHMAFAPEWIMRTLAGYGNRYGADFNAYTGYDRTVYSFSIPSDCDSALGHALRVVRYWLADMQFSKARVEQEKGIIAREIADFAPEDPLSGAKLAGNPRYARFPIGRAERVQRITCRRLENFYRRHYAPCAATLIVAGPIDTVACRAAIAAAFSDVPPCKHSAEHPELDIFASQIPSYNVQPAGTDGTCRMDLFWPYRYGVQNTRGQWLRNVGVQACASVLNGQLFERDAQLTYSVDWYLNHEGFISLIGHCAGNERPDTLVSHALGVVHGMARHCKQEELFHALRDKALEISLRAGLPFSAAEAADRMVSEALVEVEGGATVAEREWIASAIRALDTAEWRALLLHVLPSGAPLVTHLQGYELTREEMAHAVAKGENLAMQPSYAQFIASNSSTKIPRVEIPDAYARSLFPYAQPTRKEYLQSMDANLYTISEGVPLLTKRTRGDDSVVYIVATWRGGLLDTSLYGREVQEALGSVLDICSVPGLSRGALDSLMYQEGISQLFAVGPAAHRVMLACPARRVGLAMRLLRGRLLRPVWGTAAFDAYRVDCIEIERERAESPQREMRPTQRLDAYTTRLIDPTFSVEEPGERVWQSVRVEDLHRYFTALYAQGDGLQIVAVGPVEGDTIATAIAQNFDLPRREALSSRRTVPQLTLQDADIPLPEEGPAMFIAYWRGKVQEGGLRGSLIVKLMRDALQDEVLRTLRLESQLVYSPYATIRYDMVGTQAFTLIVNGECEAAALPEARAAAEVALEVLAREVIAEARIRGYRRAFLASKGRTLTPYAPTAWRDWMVESLEEGVTPAELDQYEEILNSITPETLRQAFEHLLEAGDVGFVAVPL